MNIPILDSYERTNLSSNTLAVLVDFAAADLSRPLSNLDVDWEEVFAGVMQNGLIGLAYHYLSANPTLSSPPPTFRGQVKRAFILQSLRTAWINRNIRQVLGALNDSGIDYLVVKGPAVAQMLFPKPNLRVYNDLDLVVRERNWEDLSRLLFQLEYSILAGQPAPPPKVIPQETDHETEYLNAEENFRVEAHYDDILRTGLMARDAEAFWRRSIQLEFEGIPIRTLCLEDHLTYLCAHAHHHGYSRLNWFSDIALIVRDRADQVNWQALAATIRAEDAQVPVYYTLHYLERLMGIHAPASFMERIRPDAFRRRVHDLLMPPDKVLSFEPLPDFRFSFYFWPLYQRLLPDLMVMGRRKEKLTFLLRLLAPPRDWLRYYYNLDQDGWIDYYYLLHPLKVAGIYIKETYLALMRRRWNRIR